MKVIKQKAFIIQGETPRTLYREMWDFQHHLYEKRGPCLLGDGLKPKTRIEVKQGETAFEVFSPSAEAWVRKNFPEAREVQIKWYPNL